MRARGTDVILIVVWICGPLLGTAWAQSAVTGGIAGVVKDTSGAVLPGVTVEASSPALIERIRTVVTDGEGRYNIVDLRPGTYEVSFTLSGFAQVKREGIVLTAGFTAPVNAELRVGALEETVIVTSASPVVDTQNVRTQNVLSRQEIDDLPTGRSLSGYTALTVGLSVGGAPDVGGITGELTGNLTIHGSQGRDQKYTMDGMLYNAAYGTAGGYNRIYFLNHGGIQEVAIETGGMTAETETGGVSLNVIPKEGGNVFSGVGHVDGSWNALLTNNRDTAPPHIRRLYDTFAGLGGPLARDKLWFYGSFRKNEASQEIANNYFNGNQGAITNGVTFYAPDRSRPAYTSDQTRDQGIRITWQAAEKHKLTFGTSFQNNCLCYYGVAFNLAPESTNLTYFVPKLFQTKWTYPVTKRLLAEVGATYMRNYFDDVAPAGVTAANIPITELSTGYTYNAALGTVVVPTGYMIGHQANGRAGISSITGSNSLKIGFQWWLGWNGNLVERSSDVSYAFRNGLPVSLTYWAKPIFNEQRNRELGLFVQDQWAVRRFTFNFGARLDALKGWVPAQTRPAGRFAAELPIAKIDNVPNWKDISPRLGIAYDLFGNGKTALKLSYGRYPQSEAVSIATNVNPANAIVTSATRTWNDNGDFIPQENELGPLSNSAFGTVVVNTRYDPALLSGWGIRPWQQSLAASVQHELRAGIALTAAYYRTWFGNFQITDNLSVTPADYSPYCITAPVDVRLPGGGGNQLCGLYDLNPSKVGQVNNLVTNVSNAASGKHSEIYNGVDFIVSAEPGRRLHLNGGLNFGRSVVNDCLVVDSPQQARPGFCRSQNPFTPVQTGVRPTNGLQVKVNVAYMLPWWDLLASAVLQNGPGYPILANYVATNGEIAPSLGRNLAACGAALVCNAFVTIPIIEQDTMHLPRMNQIDVRLTKGVRMGRTRLRGMFDIYNLSNANDAIAVNYTYGPSWLRPTNILLGRLIKFGAEVAF